MGKQIKWENGIPVPVYTKPITSEAAERILPVAASLDYVIKKDKNGEPLESEVQYDGCSMLEVAARKAWKDAAGGNVDTFTKLMDRWLGKPKQQTENINVELNITEIVNEVKEPKKPSLNYGKVREAIGYKQDAEVVDVESVTEKAVEPIDYAANI